MRSSSDAGLWRKISSPNAEEDARHEGGSRGANRPSFGLAATRVLSLSALLVCWLTQGAEADVRHPRFPAKLRGLWSIGADSCKARSQSQIFVGKYKVRTAKGKCKIEYVVKSAAPSGPVYSGSAICPASDNNPRSRISIVIKPLGNGKASIGSSLAQLTDYDACPK